MRRVFFQPWVASILIALVSIAAWQFFTAGPSAIATNIDPEYARLAGQSAAPTAGGAIPTPVAVARRGWELLVNAFDRSNPNNYGIAWHLLYSLGRVLLGYTLAVLVAVPLGFALGLWPALYQALNPFIQILRPVSPLAWMPLALYAFRDSTVSTIFIIFICAVWPMLINTAVGAGSVRSEWLNVSRVFGVGTLEHVTRVVFPASVPMIMTGMRISIGIAWFVIVAAEMVGAQSGVGYFIWSEWNNLQISSMIVAIVLIGTIGLALDAGLAWLSRRLSFRE
ncbi:bicarbonate transport system permease protein CmpB [Variibacter gotjawalensis]|uniref:Bicarbonate transport system permease protein CmpB n=1 Tax=Variibacter gotjawalensis TaxID=1333996 RepID=A0A0S3Q041_9BRAD|nr:ABC transporter permease [Variibacter gotjawalensis]NIK47373.1 nitrate/nitrite transport system permease protein [Variibacter gotjawalensis]RZS49269.1 nitrate/nitrite transport system permease protein [Variibacter gotjawalensis]BAT61533.1 bicarbonate transport system permease protein CmpB [Variibacter gotjawalensis]